MAHYMFRTPRPPYAPLNVSGGYQSQCGDLTMSKLVPMSVNFHGTSLSLINKDEKAFVALKPICEALCIQWEAQLKRIRRNPVLSQGVSIMDIPSNGGSQEMICLPLSMLNGWLFGINANRVNNPEIRKKLIEYQFECYDALNSYWSGKTVSHKHELSIMNLTALCSHMVWLEGWWHQYGGVVRGFNPNVAAAVHDHFNNGSFVAGQFIEMYGLYVDSPIVTRNYPWGGSYVEKHNYLTLTNNEKRKAIDRVLNPE